MSVGVFVVDSKHMEWFSPDMIAAISAGELDDLELTHSPAHPVLSQDSQERVPDGSPLEVPGRVQACKESCWS